MGKSDRCECADKGCPCCHGACKRSGLFTLYRVDMEDATGTLMCHDCMADAMESGLFTEDEPEEPIGRGEDEEMMLEHALYPWLDDDSMGG